MPRTPTQPPIAYRDRQSRVWYVSGRSSVHRYRLPQDLTTTPVSAPPRPKQSRYRSRLSPRSVPTSWRTSTSGRSASGTARRCSTSAERSSDDVASSPA